MIVAEADRVIDTETIIRRTLQFGQKHYPDLSPEEHLQRAVNHLKEKYGNFPLSYKGKHILKRNINLIE